MTIGATVSDHGIPIFIHFVYISPNEIVHVQIHFTQFLFT